MRALRRGEGFIPFFGGTGVYHITMKSIVGILLIVLMVSSEGCMMTESTLNHARGKNPFDDRKSLPPEPGYYALLPLAFIGDIATSPIQGTILLLLYIHGF